MTSPLSIVRFYLANRSDDTPWVVLQVQSFDAYYGSTAFSKNSLPHCLRS